jgi:hypothetical protein
MGLRLNMPHSPFRTGNSSSHDDYISALGRDLGELRFSCENCHDGSKPARHQSLTSRRVLAIRPSEGKFQDVEIHKDADGNLSFSEHVALPKARLAVIVAMGYPRAKHYDFLHQLEDHPDIDLDKHKEQKAFHVIIWCTAWEPRLLEWTPRNSKWTVIVDPGGEMYPGVKKRATEHYRYLTHLSLFGDQLADWNAFIQDDTQDVVYKKVGKSGAEEHPHNHGLHLMDRFNAILHARQPPHFMYLISRLGVHVARTELEKRHGARCGNKSVTYGLFLKNALLVERTTPASSHVFYQHMESFIVSRARIRNVLPSKEAYGRILHRAEDLKCNGDIGTMFEQTWSFLFSLCGSNATLPDRCALDMGSCSYGPQAGNLSTICA